MGGGTPAPEIRGKPLVLNFVCVWNVGDDDTVCTDDDLTHNQVILFDVFGFQPSFGGGGSDRYEARSQFSQNLTSIQP